MKNREALIRDFWREFELMDPDALQDASGYELADEFDWASDEVRRVCEIGGPEAVEVIEQLGESAPDLDGWMSYLTFAFITIFWSRASVKNRNLLRSRAASVPWLREATEWMSLDD